MTSSFQRKSRSKVIQIPGAKPSLYNKQLLVSTGIPSLDQIIGGGMAVGTVLLVEEDTYGSYARLMMKYFCAEAVMTGHSLFLTSADADPSQLLQELPAPILDTAQAVTEPEPTEGALNIAWRYKHLPKFQSGNTSAIKFGHYYDLTKTMESDLVETINITKISGDTLANTTSPSAIRNPRYTELLQRISHEISDGGFSTTARTDKRNILRIALHALGSPLWGENGGLTHRDHHDPSLPTFLLGLRAILRSAYAACVITVPSHLFCDGVFVRRLERLCDTVVHLDSFVGSDKEKNPAYKEYHGLLNIKQLPRLNSLVCHMPDSLDLAFKLRRKKFTIEKLHLPPDLSDSASRPQEDPVIRQSSSISPCNTGKKNKLDF